MNLIYIFKYPIKNVELELEHELELELEHELEHELDINAVITGKTHAFDVAFIAICRLSSKLFTLSASIFSLLLNVSCDKAGVKPDFFDIYTT